MVALGALAPVLHHQHGFDIQKSSDGTTWGAPVGGSNYDQFTDVDGNATRDFPIQEPAATGITYVAYEEHLFID